MKKMIATAVALATLCSCALCQGQLNAELVQCNAIRLSFSPDHTDSKETAQFTYWLERQIAPGIWSARGKKSAAGAGVVFENIPPGIYRAVGMEDKTAGPVQVVQSRSIEALTPAKVIEVRSCAKERPDLQAASVSLYPNPVAGILHLFIGEGDVAEDTWLEIIDLTGKKLRFTQITGLQQDIDLSDLASGMYIAGLTQRGTTVFRQQIVVLTKN